MQHSYDIPKAQAGVHPLCRVGHPKDCAAVVAFLASKTSWFITGHNILVNGGWNYGQNLLPGSFNDELSWYRAKRWMCQIHIINNRLGKSGVRTLNDVLLNSRSVQVNSANPDAT
ncbi:hypothetical protein DPMN_145147 [Dreissena polymorpha]|uniref:Uncharacterized protein n=1 Tax=Dreissena polymorpha TaxID=45954 RepID=A0A9D4J0R2_DREPO|nr:hypothetical protein DPMN_145147 [Dreissena polymorpha]